MKHFSHLNTATQIIQQYDGREPLHHFLKSFFSRQKKFGSKDRKRIGHLCYSFYRAGRAFQIKQQLSTETIQEIILASLFLCSNESDLLLEITKPMWNGKTDQGPYEKQAAINHESGLVTADLTRIFPVAIGLSNTIEAESFGLSHLDQPDLFIRARPGKVEGVRQKIEKLEIGYEFIPPSAVRLPAGTKVDEMFSIDRDVVIQDLSSQKIGEFLKPLAAGVKPVSVWDCCAASGGKSILAKDILGNIELTVSDIRDSILVNLKKRLAAAGITGYKGFVADLASEKPPLRTGHFDILIADLPCTGSGTWGRTPEQLYFFKTSSIEKYSKLQKQILINVVPHMKQTGKLLYTTCSVFKQENEEVVEFLLKQFPMKVERMEVLKGYNTNADTMFGALLSFL